MGYPTDTTIWPRPLPSAEIRDLIDRLFLLTDTRTEDVGERLAKDVFTTDGRFMLPYGTFEGAAEISQSRKDAWASVKSRRHVVSKVYLNDAHSTDLILIGSLAMEALDGVKSNMEFVARVNFELGGLSGARVREYRIISPPAQDRRSILE
ncbi:hypothetical protein FE257_010421 [Aspergillus nanangensis]|uniref:SnoaL-like domain-containing protein n=1 Tax=Aspergillus nanangensis TaxID=2582783 RepID=A0AAD4CJ06_ASPNN|nr:hypothetical protein FE257_010421 [Aspergillus nanangensis]